MAYTYTESLLSDKDFPAATLRMYPAAVSWKHFSLTARSLEDTNVYYLDHARTGFYLIGKTFPERRIWLPSYHCRVLIDPFIAAGSDIRIYPVDQQLQPDMDFLQTQLQAGDVLIGVRFFGFESGMAEMAQLAGQQQALMVEDLSHAAFCEDYVGDIALKSLYKFFPMQQGASLIINSEAGLPILAAYEQLPSSSAWLCNKVMRKLKLSHTDPGQQFRGLLPKDALILQTGDLAANKTRRLQNYQMYVEMLKDANTLSLLKTDPGTDVPYCCPVMAKSDDLILQLRKAGIQVFRWEELLVSEYTDQSLRHRLLQLPCHQQIHAEDIKRICGLLSN